MIRILPAVDQRVETGVVRFGDDWPGIFIRGDQALAMAYDIDGYRDVLIELLLSCDMKNFRADKKE